MGIIVRTSLTSCDKIDLPSKVEGVGKPAIASQVEA